MLLAQLEILPNNAQIMLTQSRRLCTYRRAITTPNYDVFQISYCKFICVCLGPQLSKLAAHISEPFGKCSSLWIVTRGKHCRTPAYASTIHQGLDQRAIAFSSQATVCVHNHFRQYAVDWNSPRSQLLSTWKENFFHYILNIESI